MTFGPNQYSNILRFMEIKMYTHFEISELSLQLSGDFVRRVEVKRNADFLSNLAREGFISPSHSEKEN